MTLKRLSCVSFAGVDSLDDVKNHTYNELFVSGGFVVSDESVLNPESLTTGQCETSPRTPRKPNVVVREVPLSAGEESRLAVLVGFSESFS